VQAEELVEIEAESAEEAMSKAVEQTKRFAMGIETWQVMVLNSHELAEDE
jgi:hypothetical protein